MTPLCRHDSGRAKDGKAEDSRGAGSEPAPAFGAAARVGQAHWAVAISIEKAGGQSVAERPIRDRSRSRLAPDEPEAERQGVARHRSQSEREPPTQLGRTDTYHGPVGDGDRRSPGQRPCCCACGRLVSPAVARRLVDSYLLLRFGAASAAAGGDTDSWLVALTPIVRRSPAGGHLAPTAR